MAASRLTGRFALGSTGLLLVLALALLLPADGAAKAKKRANIGFSIAQGTLQVNGSPNQLESGLYVPCPSGKFPYGGAVSASPSIGAAWQGVYPLGFERRGAQKDVHFVLMQFAPMGTFTPRVATGQTVCGPKPRGLVPVQNLIQVDSGQKATFVATCPAGRFLIGGNFARTYFTPQGGDFASQAESEIDSNSFVVSVSSFGSFGGPATATAFCANTTSYTGTASLPVTVLPGSAATATSPSCAIGNRVVWGGFDTNPRGSVVLAGTTFNPDQSYSVTAYNKSSTAASFQAYGYCLSKNAFRKVKRKKP